MQHFLEVFFLLPAWSELNTACMWEKLLNISHMCINNKQNVEENTFLEVMITSFGISSGFEEKLLADFCSFGHNLSASANLGLSVGDPQSGCQNSKAVSGAEKETRADIKIKSLKFSRLSFSQRTLDTNRFR